MRNSLILYLFLLSFYISLKLSAELFLFDTLDAHEIEELLVSQESNPVQKITLTPEARSWLAEKGYDPLLGARPMGRVIQKEIKDPLTDEILFGKLKSGGNVAITIEINSITFVFSND